MEEEKRPKITLTIEKTKQLLHLDLYISIVFILAAFTLSFASTLIFLSSEINTNDLHIIF